jgi:hypothetical protein
MKYLFFLILSLNPLEAQIFHAFLVGDTTDPLIGASVKQDLKLVVQKIAEVSHELQLPLKKTLIVGQLVTPTYILATLDQLLIDENDIFLFYFSGHGYRTESKISQWPNLLCTHSNEGFDLGAVISLIEEKNPQLKLIISDVCNNILKEETAPPVFSRPLQARSLFKTLSSESLVKLFLKTKGSIIATSSQSGEFAYCTNSGGFFTKFLIESI